MRRRHDGETMDSSNYLTTDDFHVNSCGVQATQSTEIQVIREKGRLDYHVLYLVRGNCRAYYGGAYHSLEAGNFVFYEPGHRQEYLYEEGIDTFTFWIHFHGSGIPDVLQDCHLAFGPHLAPKSRRVEQCFEQLVHACGTAPRQSQTYVNGLLLLLLAELGNRGVEKEMPGPVLDAQNYIHLNYFRALDIGELAKKCGLSRSRLMHVFKESTGTSLLQYQLRFRLEKARELLEIESLSVAQIASMTGFEDALYFSRVFRKGVGMAPTEYRRAKDHLR